jgi:hypothetical protein
VPAQKALDEIAFRTLVATSAPSKSSGGVLHTTARGSVALLLMCDGKTDDEPCVPIGDAAVIRLRDGSALGRTNTDRWRGGPDFGKCGLQADFFGVSVKRRIAVVGFSSIVRGGDYDICGDGPVTRFIPFEALPK